LVGRSGQHRRRTAVHEGGDVQAVIIDRNRNRLDTVVSQHHPVQPKAGILHRQRLVYEHGSEQRDGLCRARAEHDVLRVGEHAAGAPQIVSHSDARG
jgi:hypothetical protein